MKKRFTLLALVTWCLLAFLSSCTGGDGAEPDTQLEVTVQSTSGGVHQNAEVRLFLSLNDWLVETNQAGETKTTNSEGKALFTELENKKYYWLVKKGCLNNVFGFSTSTNPIEKGKRNIVYTTIEGTGVVTLISTSADAFQLFVDDEKIAIINPMETRDFRVKEGNYTIKVVQINGAAQNPIEKTYQVSIGCGQIESVSFP